MPVFQPDNHNRRAADSRQLHDLIGEARHMLDILEHGHQPDDTNPTHVAPLSHLVDLARQQRTIQAYPTTTRREGGRGSVVDEHGTPMPQLSDPVGEAVVTALASAGPARPLLATVTTSLQSAVRDLRCACGALARATPTEPSSANPTGEPGCKIHAQHGKWEPIYRNDRCRWDYEFWLANKGVDTPLSIMQARLDGRRVTQAMVNEALAPPERTRIKRHSRRVHVR